MYASFLLKYSKSYLHTCIIFYMFILFFFFFSFNATRADVSHPSPRFGYTQSLPRYRILHGRKQRFVTFLPLSLSIDLQLLPFSLSINGFYFSLRFVRHRSSTMNTVRYASAIRERERKKKEKKNKRRKRVPRKSRELTRPASSVYVYVYVRTYICMMRVCLCVCVLFTHVYPYACINLILSSLSLTLRLCIVLRLIVDTAINVPGCAKERSVSLEICLLRGGMGAGGE